VRAAEDGLQQLNWEEDGFAYAEGFDEAKQRYRGLVAQGAHAVSPGGLLVKPDVAQTQIEEEQKEKTPKGEHGLTPSNEEKGEQLPQPPEPRPEKILPKRFYGRVPLDHLRLGTAAGQIGEEVLSHLSGLPDAQVEVIMEIRIEAPEGVPEDKQRIVNENCRTIGFEAHEFEEE
jgi:hypothetical protein